MLIPGASWRRVWQPKGAKVITYLSEYDVYVIELPEAVDVEPV